MAYTDTINTSTKAKAVHVNELGTQATDLSKYVAAGNRPSVSVSASTSTKINKSSIESLRAACNKLETLWSNNCCQANCCQTCQGQQSNQSAKNQGNQTCETTACEASTCQTNQSNQACQSAANQSECADGNQTNQKNCLCGCGM